jgi:hypothetical protein
MASFVEMATLKVVDQSSAQINKVNAALKQLQAPSKQLAARGRFYLISDVTGGSAGTVSVGRPTPAEPKASSRSLRPIRRTGFMELPWLRLFRLHVGELDDLAPLLGFRGDELAEIGGRA